jgi:hypothetical protein
MRRLIGSIALIFSCVMIAVPSYGVEHVMSLDGVCQKLFVQKYDWTKWCKNRVVNSVTDNGDVGFTFVSSNPNISSTVTFDGRGPDQVKPSPDSVIQPVRRIIFSIAGMGIKPKEERAVGSCRFANPYKGKMTIQCSAQTHDGHFEAVFQTNGQPPDEIVP